VPQDHLLAEPPSKLARLEFAEKVIKGEIHDPGLSFDVDNGFKIIKILPNYLEDGRTLIMPCL
jgi:hypothetical protein